jgi:hypothetical protein
MQVAQRPSTAALRLNPIRVKPTSTASTRRQSRHHAHHGPAHHTERGRSHIRIVVNPDDANIVIGSDAQQANVNAYYRLAHQTVFEARGRCASRP